MSSTVLARAANFLRQGPRHWLEASRNRSKAISDAKASRAREFHQEAINKVSKGSIGCVAASSRDRCALVREAAIKALMPAALSGNDEAIRVAINRLQDFDATVRSTALRTITDIADSGDDGAVVIAFSGLKYMCKGPRFQTFEHNIAMAALNRRILRE
mmetsp:Transcript_89269/g.195715  ORF Transcript_89269/g.195715 Transcript_89269/m.195715 type:complete len:159 (-) Transcript_89269:324-800(-)